MIRRAIVAAVAAAALLQPVTGPCEPVDVSSARTMPDTAVAALLAAGWHGDPADGREALYPPTC